METQYHSVSILEILTVFWYSFQFIICNKYIYTKDGIFISFSSNRETCHSYIYFPSKRIHIRDFN